MGEMRVSLGNGKKEGWAGGDFYEKGQGRGIGGSS